MQNRTRSAKFDARLTNYAVKRQEMTDEIE